MRAAYSCVEYGRINGRVVVETGYVEVAGKSVLYSRYNRPYRPYTERLDTINTLIVHTNGYYVRMRTDGSDLPHDCPFRAVFGVF